MSRMYNEPNNRSYYNRYSPPDSRFDSSHPNSFRDSRNFEFRFMKRRAITSYGIILFTTVERNNKSEILYQLCQRRDSISYAEFLKDNLEPEDIVRMHINIMSKEERKRCVDYYLKDDPEALWDDLWINHKSRIYKNDMKRCCDSFKKNMEKYIQDFLDEEKGSEENPWGFPKGRKHTSESEIDCALREFEEETTISRENIQVLQIRPYEEFYTGTDGKLYRTVYYVAYIPYIPDIQQKVSLEGIRRTYVSEEVSNMGWYNYNSAMSKINEPKQKILRNLNRTLLFTKRRKPPPRRFTI